MNQHRFPALTRAVTGVPSRRDLVRGLVGAGIGFGAGQLPRRADAKRRKKPRPNAFGCLDVGQPCRGIDERCCSGICQGKKPKKGEKDKSRCVAHHTGGCTADRHECTNPAGAACSAASTEANCFKTTGNAGFCGELEGSSHEANCQPCRTDPDCEALGFAAGSACVIYRTEDACVVGCEGVNGSTGTACLPPAAP